MRETPDDRREPSATIARIRPTVVIVDDHPSFRRLARRLLEEAGFDIVGEAAAAASAVAVARALRPDAVLLDVLLPDATGFEVAQWLAASDGAAPRVVLTSSRSAADYGGLVEDAPVAGFVAKADLTGEAFRALVTGSRA